MKKEEKSKCLNTIDEIVRKYKGVRTDTTIICNRGDRNYTIVPASGTTYWDGFADITINCLSDDSIVMNMRYRIGNDLQERLKDILPKRVEIKCLDKDKISEVFGNLYSLALGYYKFAKTFYKVNREISQSIAT